jgi:hypothetical protein
LRSLALALVPVLILTACGTSSAPTPLPPTPAALATSAQQGAVAGATAEPAVDGSAAPSASPSEVAATMTPDPELEARIPGTVRGIRLTIISLNGKEYLARSPNSQLRDMIATLKVDEKAVSIAVGVGHDNSAQLAIAAFRFPGAKESSIAELFGNELKGGVPGSTLKTMHIGGHDVMLLVDPDNATIPTYLNVEGDTARVVQATTDGFARDAVSALP